MASNFAKKISGYSLAFQLATSNMACIEPERVAQGAQNVQDIQTACRKNLERKRGVHTVFALHTGFIVGRLLAGAVPSEAVRLGYRVVTAAFGGAAAYTASNRDTTACENDAMQNLLLRKQLQAVPGTGK
jgi:hypothetical protein